MFIFCSTHGASVIGHLLPDGLSVLYDPLTLDSTSFFSYIIYGTVLGLALLTFALLFPKPKNILLRRLVLVWLPHLSGAVLLGYFLAGGAGLVGWISTLGMLLLSTGNLLHAAATQRDPVSCAQLYWAVVGFGFGLLLFMLNSPLGFGWFSDPVLGQIVSTLADFGLAVIAGGLGIAILGYRLYDIDVIIRRTLRYTFLSALLAMPFFGCVVFFQELFQSLTGSQDSPLVTVLSTLTIAALFPLRARDQAFVGRRFYRARYDAGRTLIRFAATARDEVDMDYLVQYLLIAAQETVQPDRASLWIKK